MLQIENIRLTVGQGTFLEKTIIEDLSFRVLEGEFIVLIGGTGAGKSTLFNLISGVAKPDRGLILLKKTHQLPLHCFSGDAGP